MRRLIVYALLLCPFFIHAQQKQTDSIIVLLQKHFNNKNAEAIYALTGESFQKSISKETFNGISQNQLFPLGAFTNYSFERVKNGVVKYKADFTAATLGLYLSIDKANKLETFLFKAYVNEAVAMKPPVPSDNPMTTAMDKAIDSLVQPHMRRGSSPALSIGIYINGTARYYNYGETVKDNRKLPTATTLYEIGSITKTFTTTLLADAVRRGKMSLADPVSKYLPSVAKSLSYNGMPVTIRDLANHTSALPRMPTNFPESTDRGDPYRSYTATMMMEFLDTVKLTRTPGSVYEYSNLAMALLGYIITKVEGQTFDNLVAKTIINPLGMKSTRQKLLRTDSARFAPGYNEEGARTPAWNFDVFAPAGALRSTATDLILYGRAQLKPPTANLKKDIDLTHAVTFEKDGQKLGLGWHYLNRGGESMLAHTGGTGGYSSYLVINREKGWVVVALTNASGGSEAVGDSLTGWLLKN